MASETITKEDVAAAESLIEFIDSCPSMFHTAMTLSERLEQAGYVYLPEGSAWRVERGGSYYTRRNNSSVIAWHVGEQVAEAPVAGQCPKTAPYHFQLTASHADSPTFKVKSVGELEGPQGYLRLNVEAYGGMIDYTWFDRPLSLAGRVLVRAGARVESRLFSLDRDVAIIPSLAIARPDGCRRARRGRDRRLGARPLLGEPSALVCVGRGERVCLGSQARRPCLRLHLARGDARAKQRTRRERLRLL